jgi:hypothetical protein
MRGYKVVRRYPNGELWSAISDPEDYFKLWVRYTPGKRTVRRRNFGPLIVFRKLNNAHNFVWAIADPTLEVWECEYTMARDEHEHCMWQNGGAHVPISWNESACAHSVKLIRKMARWQG